MRALLLICFALAGTGCSTGAWNQGIPASPLLGIDDHGIWRFPTPHPPASADLTPELAPTPSATSTAEPRPDLEEPAKTRSRAPKPFACRTTAPRAL